MWLSGADGLGAVANVEMVLDTDRVTLITRGNKKTVPLTKLAVRSCCVLFCDDADKGLT